MLLVFALLCNDIWLDNEAVNIVDDSFFFRFYSVVMSCSLCCEIMNKITGTGWHARFRIIMKPYIFISALYTVWNMEGKWMAPLHLRSGIHCEQWTLYMYRHILWHIDGVLCSDLHSPDCNLSSMTDRISLLDHAFPTKYSLTIVLLHIT